MGFFVFAINIVGAAGTLISTAAAHLTFLSSHSASLVSGKGFGLGLGLGWGLGLKLGWGISKVKLKLYPSLFKLKLWFKF